MFDWNNCPELEAVPGKVSGVWVFKNTRVPVWLLFNSLDYLTIEEFCKEYPSARPEQIQCVLDCLSNHLKTPVAESLREPATAR